MPPGTPVHEFIFVMSAFLVPIVRKLARGGGGAGGGYIEGLGGGSLLCLIEAPPPCPVLLRGSKMRLHNVVHQALQQGN